ncbi:uncharacterized protein LOC102066856 [Zonotrichia albicollis]|uniref:uncharacterized protein LOC102066856 n=2 Tax=Zonotrichia TaxID=44387 RepID=UPI003D811912
MLSEPAGQTWGAHKTRSSRGRQHLSSSPSATAMDLKVVCALSITLLIALSALAEGSAPPTKCQCKVVPKERTNCGYPGISAAECKKIGCCFNASVPSVPWCYNPKQKKVKKVCPNDPYSRINCGYPRIKAKDCTRKGCCFRPHPAGVPWCFYHRVVEEAC